MKILLTGATGHLGARLARRLVAAGHEVRAFCRATSAVELLGGVPVEIARGDVRDRDSVQQAVRGCECVIHAAADVNYWRQDLARQMQVNVEGTRHVAEAARSADVRRLVHVSSVAAIGIPTNPTPADEAFRFNLEGTGLTYHLSKRLAEERVISEIDRGLNAIIVNPASIEHEERTRALLCKVRRKSWITYFSGGNCVVHPDDVVEGTLAALERGRAGERYILGGENVTFREQAEQAARLLGVDRRFLRVPAIATWMAARILEPVARMRNTPPRIAYMVHYCAQRFQFYDSTKAKRALDYRPRSFGQILSESKRTLERHAGSWQ